MTNKSNTKLASTLCITATSALAVIVSTPLVQYKVTAAELPSAQGLSGWYRTHNYDRYYEIDATERNPATGSSWPGNKIHATMTRYNLRTGLPFRRFNGRYQIGDTEITGYYQPCKKWGYPKPLTIRSAPRPDPDAAPFGLVTASGGITHLYLTRPRTNFKQRSCAKDSDIALLSSKTRWLVPDLPGIAPRADIALWRNSGNSFLIYSTGRYNQGINMAKRRYPIAEATLPQYDVRNGSVKYTLRLCGGDSTLVSNLGRNEQSARLQEMYRIYSGKHFELRRDFQDHYILNVPSGLSLKSFWRGRGHEQRFLPNNFRLVTYTMENSRRPRYRIGSNSGPQRWSTMFGEDFYAAGTKDPAITDCPRFAAE